MSEKTTPSGLLVVERGLPPRDNPPNDNEIPPAGTVGPNADEGFGDTHVMYPGSDPPIEAQAWAGWPVGWEVPSTWNSSPWLPLLDVVFAALDLNSSVLSTMPAYIVTDAVPQPPLPWLENPEPSVYASWDEFAKQLFWAYQGIGEVFVAATAKYSTGYPSRFMMLNPAFVNVEIVDGTRQYSLGGEDITGDVLHIRYMSWPGDAHGHGPLEAAGARILAAQVLARYATELARKGGIPWAVLKHPGRLSAKQSANLQRQWVAARTSAIGAPAVLTDGLELTPLSTSPKDMALAELQSMNESRLAVLLGVPPFLLGLPSGGDSLTYSTVAQIFDYHWRAGLRPKASAVMAALSNWLLPRGTGLELNRDEYVRPGLGERAAAYQILTTIGAMDTEEVRLQERLAPSPPPAATAAAALSDGIK